jgi:very-short-patch-repair endonuclease
MLPKLAVTHARRLRKSMSLPEVLLWQVLRGQPNGVKFRRQHPIGPYVVDFCCLSSRLAIEIDGVAHDNVDNANYDVARMSEIERFGFRVVRLAASDVLQDVNTVAEAIVALATPPLHHPSDGPPPRAGKE